ncbi:MAG: hypothetical protein LBS61_06360 [Endomicrobium sp.]|jgi:DNA-damage-inducible protein D|nr:hypothetical protein [Endomicrobium sp.]
MSNLKAPSGHFESIKFIDNNGDERWSARDLSALIGYDKWDNFDNVLSKAIVTAKTVNADVDYHFAEIGKMIQLPKGANRSLRIMLCPATPVI